MSRFTSYQPHQRAAMPLVVPSFRVVPKDDDANTGILLLSILPRVSIEAFCTTIEYAKPSLPETQQQYQGDYQGLSQSPNNRVIYCWYHDDVYPSTAIILHGDSGYLYVENQAEDTSGAPENDASPRCVTTISLTPAETIETVRQFDTDFQQLLAQYQPDVPIQIDSRIVSTSRLIGDSFAARVTSVDVPHPHSYDNNYEDDGDNDDDNQEPYEISD